MRLQKLADCAFVPGDGLNVNQLASEGEQVHRYNLAFVMALTRSPRVTYTWMVIAIAFVVLLFARFDAFTAHHRQGLWWGMLIAFLAMDFVFLLVPIRDRHSIRHLSAAGKAWAAAAWLLVLVFLVVVVPASRVNLRQRHPLILTGAGLVLLALLVLAVARLSGEWIRESLRSIKARPGGGFVVRFQQEAEIASALELIPGAERVETLGEWAVPANAAAATALLEFARKYDFDFVPGKKKGALAD